jgi:hypothetical protein
VNAGWIPKDRRDAVFSTIMRHFGYDESDTDDQIEAGQLTNEILKALDTLDEAGR